MKNRRMPTLLVCLLLCLCLCVPAAADKWSVFDDAEDAPDGLGFVVCEYTGTVTITFLGDCTLGGESKTSSAFIQSIDAYGYDYPFRGLTSLTENDDLTVANLECVLSDRNLKKETKTFNFMGPADYTGILQAGSIECVTMANNHSHDYGTEGYRDTREALDSAGVAHFGTDHMAVWERDGLMIGFVGVNYRATTDMLSQIKQLKQLGCAAVIVFIHAGEEYRTSITTTQEQIAKSAASAGCALLVGSHPHIVQGFNTVHGMPAIYSLGNCSFGGNSNPSDKDALAVQAELHFEEGVLTSADLHFYPISVSGADNYNDYSPVLLSGDDAQRVLDKMKASTGYEMPAFEEGTGSVIHIDY